MLDDLPQLYNIEQQDPREWAVTYEPDDTPVCFVTARPGQPAEDAEHRAGAIADIMNDTIDDIRELLSGYEQSHGTRHHADWRSSD